ncbi:DUF4241 domain-containing protein [Streptomyces sp. LS1784]|uniref:DUF4241 domain-containing protein n=1 Tax=Streptomyces sp. LS1784 TaxID=2851533 RepID=UPI001CCA4715|nr:DUF4241 domain-containing protein [Streptomyces sp. LS1784]
MDEVRPETREYLDGLFTPGLRIGGDPHTPYSWIEITEVQEVTSIRLPSGRLVVDSPRITGPARELAFRIPPGEYPVDVSWANCPRLADGYYTEHRECAATRLRVRDEPVVTWELALGVGEDPALRAAGAGFEAEDAMGCFADATAWQTLTEPFRRYLTDVAAAGCGGPPVGRDTEDLCEGYFELARDEGHRADLLTFGVPEGWGQVWEGRARDGEIAVIVAPGPVPTSPWD